MKPLTIKNKTQLLKHTTYSILAYLAICFALIVPIQAYGQGRSISGVVIDSASTEPVPFASVMLKSAGWGKLTDDNGKFTLSSPAKNDSLIVTAMGYSREAVALKDLPAGSATIAISPIGVAIKEVVVRPRKEKYSKRNNPAVDFVNRIRNSFDLTDPRNNDYYGFDKYERITLALNDIHSGSTKNLILKQFDFLRQYIDTSEVSGKPILNISNREKLSHNYYRKSPRAEKEFIDGITQGGLDDFMDQDNMRLIYEDFFSDIDLYNNDIYLLHTKFVSPLSKIGPDFYKYYLTDTLNVGGERCIELTFAPRNSATVGFVGKIYVPEADTTMFIKKVVMSVPKDINVNFIDKIYIEQEFERGPAGERLLKKDDLTAEISIIKGTQGLYVRRNTAYDNFSFSPASDWYVYDIPGQSVINPGAKERGEEYWNTRRLVEIKDGENMASEVASALRGSPLYYWGEKFIKIFANGYVGTNPKGPSRFDIGPVNTFVSHNSVEGFRLRFGGMTTANLSPRLFARGYAAYGIKDHRWKYNAELEYSFRDKEYHSREFPVHALRVSHKYDVDMLGQHYAFTNADNMFLSFKRKEDYQMTYLRTSKLEYILELENHFSINLALQSQRQESSPYMTFVNGFGKSFTHYDETGINVTLRYAPGERIYQKKTSRVSISPENPVFELSHLYAPRRLFGNMFEINRTEISMTKRFWLSAFGCIDGVVKGGHLWSRSPYPNLLIPNANLSYTIQPESFAMMNPMEFITDSYLMWDVTYWANGAILNYVPLIKKLKLREVFSFRGVWGHLSHKNRPDENPELFAFPAISNSEPIGHKPYMEASVGLDNIFRILRVDYVWRLSYRNRPDIDKSGLRIALHFSF